MLSFQNHSGLFLKSCSLKLFGKKIEVFSRPWFTKPDVFGDWRIDWENGFSSKGKKLIPNTKLQSKC